MDEFALIRRYFADLTSAREGVVLGIGDDAAVLAPAPGQQLVVTCDTLIAGRHFPLDTAPYDIGWKSLAVNLSDLAAMGATPRWFTLALSLPAANETWLGLFSAGLKALADRHGVALVGGDTTRGDLSITITAIGEVPSGQAMLRSGAREGDVVCVTGTLGDAAAGLALLQQGSVDVDLRARLDRPEPRVAAGLALRGVAHAAIDLSDGLAGDLQHVLDALPASDVLRQRFPIPVAAVRRLLIATYVMPGRSLRDRRVPNCGVVQEVGETPHVHLGGRDVASALEMSVKTSACASLRRLSRILMEWPQSRP